MSENKKILEIYDDIPITQHTVYAMPLAVILSHESYWVWFYQNFVQVYSTPLIKSKAKQELLYYGRGELFDQVLLNVRVSEIENIKDIIEYIIKQIDNLTYIQLLLDMFFIKEKNTFNKVHYNHRILIFGYNREKKVFYVKGYNQKFMFSTYMVGFDEINNAFIYYKSKINLECQFAINIVSLRKKKYEKEFSIEKYKKSLKNYLNSENELDEFKREGHSLQELRYFGVKAYKDFSEYIKIAIKNGYDILYHDFHLFYEHRKLHLERFKYINKFFDQNICVDKYFDLVMKCDQLRMLYMKKAFKQGSLYSQIRDVEVMLGLKKEIDVINEREVEILVKIEQSI